MALCDCGETTARLRQKCTAPDGRPLPQPWKTVCPTCSPDEFQDGRILNDHKVWLMQDVAPQEYETVAGRTRLKDWAQADLEKRMQAAPDEDTIAQERARAKKREQAREVRTVLGTKLPEGYISRIDAAVREGRVLADAQNAGLVLP